jgi:hypothetical protein
MEKYKLSIWSKIYLWWKHKAIYYHKDFYNGVKNLIKWLPVIWKDRNWDDSYIWKILKTKLCFQADYIRKHGIHLNHIRDAERMELCTRLIDDIQNDFYSIEPHDYHSAEIHFIPIENNPGYSTIETTEIWENYDEYFKKYPHAYREVTKTDKYLFENDSKQKIAMNMGYYLQNKANRLLFRILETHLQSWWD